MPAHVLDANEPARLRILLAEDEDVNALVATTMLTRFGHDVARVADGEAALEALCSESFDVALIDVRMPRLDGLEVIARFRATEERGRRAPIVALTANALPGDAEICIAAGADAYLAKPIDTASLRATLAYAARALPQFDREGFLARMAGDADIARDVATTYVLAWSSLFGALHSAIKVSDFDAVARATATIRDAALLVGGVRTGERTRDLTTAAQRKDAGRASALARRLADAGDDLVIALRAFTTEA